MEVRNTGDGRTYTITARLGDTLSIGRNSSPGRPSTNGYNFFVKAADSNGYNEVYGAFTEEQMLEFFAAFLAVRETYDGNSI